MRTDKEQEKDREKGGGVKGRDVLGGEGLALELLGGGVGSSKSSDGLVLLLLVQGDDVACSESRRVAASARRK